MLEPFSCSLYFILASLLQMFWSSGELPGATLIQVKLNRVEQWNIWMSEDIQEKKNPAPSSKLC